MTAAAPVKEFRLVPFNPMWITHDKLDIHAIYRRPGGKVKDEYGEEHPGVDADGNPLWDITSPLPVRQHNRIIAKGYEYVTLADRDSLIMAWKTGTLVGSDGQPVDWKHYDQHREGGPWNWRLYKESQAGVLAQSADILRRDVEEFGSEVVQKIRRQTDPHFTLPANLQGIKPKGGKA